MKTKLTMFVKSSVPNREYSICPLKFINGNLHRQCKKAYSDFYEKEMTLIGKYKSLSDLFTFCVVKNIPILMKGKWR